MKFNEAGLKLIKEFEGCRLTVYLDLGGLPTVGYGHRTDMSPGETITQEEADRLLTFDLGNFEKGVKLYVSPTTILNDNQFSSLVCFSYNLGLGTLQHSKLLRKINENDFEGAANEFLKWVHVNGQVQPGLVRRRQAEKDLFELLT